MTRSRLRLLLNAEPFGFGPAAAVASLAPLLQKNGMQVSYIGEGHTLDLQNDLAYETVYDTTNMTNYAKYNLMCELTSKYDLFFTALDFNMAEIAEKVDLDTIIYDSLTWYWPTIHPSIKNAKLYLAQQFFGVEERLIGESSNFPAYRLVPPIVSTGNKGTEKQHILLNMGGLQNPYWSFDDTIAYAKLILEAIKFAIPKTETVVITTSSNIAKALNDPRVITLPRQSMIEALAKSKVAIMTPGLGNIYDAASFDIPTLWLPPANDSQGQQAMLLMESGSCDESMDWSELTDFIDYKAPQMVVLQDITHALRSIESNGVLKRNLFTITKHKLRSLNTYQNSKTKNLLQLFGTDGTTDICAAVVGHVESNTYAGTE